MSIVQTSRTGRRWLGAFDPVDPVVPNPLVGAAAGVVLVALLVPIVGHWNGASGPLGQSIPLLFLVPVLLTAAVAGQGAGVFVACVAILAWDWFFIPPIHRITIASARDVVALIVFLVVALLTGQLSTAARRRTDEALRRAVITEALYDLSMALIARRRLTEVLPSLTERLRQTFGLEACAVLLRDESAHAWRTANVAGSMSKDLNVETSRNVAAMASWVDRHGEICRLREDTKHGRSVADAARVQFLPLRAGNRPIGVLELVGRQGDKPDAERERLLTTLANGVAIALEQERLSEEERDAELARESDRLKSSLLSSVSHDLRTPLAGIKAAASSLLQQDIEWSEEERRAFLTDIDAEADRLSRLVSNLLDVSRIEAGAIKPVKDWEDVEELINRVVRRLEPRLKRHMVIRDIDENLPVVQLDVVQIEQVLTNLIENAAKYSPPDAPITVSAAMDSGEKPQLRVAVSDQGPGIAAHEQRRIFDKFYRVPGSGKRSSGTGMGLAIVKGLVEAHGGRVSVRSAAGRGSTFTFVLPVQKHQAKRRIDVPVPETTERLAQ